MSGNNAASTAMVVTRDGTHMFDEADMRELGASGVTVYGGVVAEDYNPKLRGRKAIEVYDEMRRSEGAVRQILRVVKVPLLAAQWYVQPASDSPRDVEMAEFIEWNLHNMSRTFTQVLWETLLCMDFGYYIFEKVYDLDTWTPSREGARKRRVTKWKKMGPRHPNRLVEWLWDVNGGVAGIKHNRGIDPRYQEVIIPIEKLLICTLDEEAGNPEGISILRSAYKHWFFKSNLEKVDGIQKERHGIGVPVVKLPIGYTKEDKTLANQLGESLRTNERAHVVLPPGWDLSFAEIKTQPADALASATYHGMMIAKNVLAQFLELGLSEAGSRSVGSTLQDIFTKSLRYMADLVRGYWNQYCIPQLISYNYSDVTKFPELRVRRIGEEADWRAFSVAVRNLVEVGLITPTPELEEWLADQMDFPQPTQDALDRTIEDRLPTKGPTPTPGQSPEEPDSEETTRVTPDVGE
jgi:hypothetical protein